MSAALVASQVLRSSRIGTVAAQRFLAELDLHAKSPADLIGALRAQVLSLSADLAVARLDGLGDHAKAIRLVGDARDIVGSWLDHPVAGDEAAGVHKALGGALIGLEATFFDAPEESPPDTEWQSEARAQRAELRLVRGAA